MTQEVDRRPDWLVINQAEGTTPGTLEIDGALYTYTVVKTGLEPGLPYTVGFPSKDSLFISEDVPDRDRAFILAHEVREKTRFAHLPEEERCKQALEIEIDEVSAQARDRYTDYVLARRAFFEALVKFYDRPEQNAAVTPEFKRGILAARNYIIMYC